MVERRWLWTVLMYLVLGLTLVVALHTAWHPLTAARYEEGHRVRTGGVVAAVVGGGGGGEEDVWPPRERRDAAAGSSGVGGSTTPAASSGSSGGGGERLLDLRNFSFLHLPRVDPACGGGGNHSRLLPPTWLGIVSSAPSHFYHRRQIRSTWANNRQVFFLLGKANATIQPLVEKEVEEFGDIVQGNFIDSYRNMTYKHVMGLMWASQHCPGASYILKTDDDVFVNTAYLESYLPSLPDHRLIFCEVMKASLVQRSYRSKWRVTPEEYQGRWYPPYCAGWVVLFSPDVVNSLYSQAQKERYFWIDDVHITGTVAEKLNITHTPLGKLGLSDPETSILLSGEPRTDFLFSLTGPTNFQRLWTMVKDVSSNDI